MWGGCGEVCGVGVVRCGVCGEVCGVRYVGVW